jgi:hypothetical protein
MTNDRLDVRLISLDDDEGRIKNIAVKALWADADAGGPGRCAIISTTALYILQTERDEAMRENGTLFDRCMALEAERDELRASWYQARADLATERQRREEAERERDSMREELRSGWADAEARADRLERALRLCVDWMPRAVVRSWPPGFRLRDEALVAARDALLSTTPPQEGG